jgi:hypothetical protein
MPTHTLGKHPICVIQIQMKAFIGKIAVTSGGRPSRPTHLKPSTCAWREVNH